MFQEIKYNEYLDEVLSQLEKGAFLTVKAHDKVNTMTIGWGTIGFIWGKPVLQVMVRPSRYTYELIEASDYFTVSVPLDGSMKKELGFCGTKSGRDVDKIKECQLELLPGKTVDVPIIANCSLHYECKIVVRQTLYPEDVNDLIREKAYPNGDYHKMYYGIILNAYKL